MSKINERPVIIKINDGEIVNSVNALNSKTINIDLFNGDINQFNNYTLKFDQINNKFIIGEFIPFSVNYDLSSCLRYNTLYLNGEEAQMCYPNLKNGFVVGTHIGEEIPSDDLLSKRHEIKTEDFTVNAEFDFIYVQMTTGVMDNFGNKKNRKTSQNTLGTASQIKELCDKNDVKLGFSHYLTGSDQDPEAAGINQAKKFLKAIVGSETEIKDKTALEGGMIPMVIFMDNITQVGYYGSAPYGVIKSEEII